MKFADHKYVYLSRELKLMLTLQLTLFSVARNFKCNNGRKYVHLFAFANGRPLFPKLAYTM